MSNAKINKMKPSEEQKIKLISLQKEGIEFSFPDDETIVIKQKEIPQNRLFSNKQLYVLVKEIFPESKIIPVVFSLNLNIVTIEWVTKQMQLYGIKSKDLQRQLGFKKEIINNFLKSGSRLEPTEKAALFYYFLTFERV